MKKVMTSKLSHNSGHGLTRDQSVNLIRDESVAKLYDEQDVYIGEGNSVDQSQCGGFD